MEIFEIIIHRREYGRPNMLVGTLKGTQRPVESTFCSLKELWDLLEHHHGIAMGYEQQSMDVESQNPSYSAR